MARDQIVVRTPADKEREAHEAQLMEQIRLENRNPLQQAGESVWDRCADFYHRYVYTSGMLLVLFASWSVYPTLVRYRHTHIKRYRRDQLVFRRWFFGSVHMPKWDKKLLQRIEIPPPLQYQSQPDLYSAAAAVGAHSSAQTHLTVAQEAPSDVAVGLNQKIPVEERPFTRRTISSKVSSKGKFHAAFESESAAAIDRAMAEINDSVYNQHRQFNRAVDESVDLADVKSRIEWAVHKGKACVVLKEDHTVVRSIPPGWEVWWVSAEEQKRRDFCKFWLMILIFCRIMQDLLDMPEMPKFIQ